MFLEWQVTHVADRTVRITWWGHGVTLGDADHPFEGSAEPEIFTPEATQDIQLHAAVHALGKTTFTFRLDELDVNLFAAARLLAERGAEVRPYCGWLALDGLVGPRAWLVVNGSVIDPSYVRPRDGWGDESVAVREVCTILTSVPRKSRVIGIVPSGTLYVGVPCSPDSALGSFGLFRSVVPASDEERAAVRARYPHLQSLSERAYEALGWQPTGSSWYSDASAYQSWTDSRTRQFFGAEGSVPVVARFLNERMLRGMTIHPEVNSLVANYVLHLLQMGAHAVGLEVGRHYIGALGAGDFPASVFTERGGEALRAGELPASAPSPETPYESLMLPDTTPKPRDLSFDVRISRLKPGTTLAGIVETFVNQVGNGLAKGCRQFVLRLESGGASIHLDDPHGRYARYFLGPDGVAPAYEEGDLLGQWMP